MTLTVLQDAEDYAPQAGDTLVSICADQRDNHDNPLTIKALLRANFDSGISDDGLMSALIERHGCDALAEDPKAAPFPEGATGTLKLPKVRADLPIETGKAHKIQVARPIPQTPRLGFALGDGRALQFAPGVPQGVELTVEMDGGISERGYCHFLQASGERTGTCELEFRWAKRPTVRWDGKCNLTAGTSTIPNGKLCTKQHGPYTALAVSAPGRASIEGRFLLRSFDLAWPEGAEGRRNPADAEAASREVRWTIEGLTDLHEGHLRIRDANGQVVYVKRLEEGDLGAGEHTFAWDGSLMGGGTALAEDQLPLAPEIRAHSRAGTERPTAVAALLLRAKAPEITDVAWHGNPAPTTIDPPHVAAGAAARRQVAVKALYTEPEDIEIKLYGEYAAGGDPVELPFSVLLDDGLPRQLAGPQRDVLYFERDGGQVLPELKLSFGTTQAVDGSDVYLMDFARFQVTAEIRGLPETKRESLPLARRQHVAIFANPDAEEDQDRFWDSGETIRGSAAAAGHLAVLEVGRDPAVPSAWENGRTRGPIAAGLAVTHMRGASHFHYRGHGNMQTVDDQDPCSICKWRRHWDDLEQKRKERYLARIIAPQRWDGNTGRWVDTTWSELKRLSKRAEVHWVRLVLDESRADPDFDPRTTAGNVRTRKDKLKGAFKKKAKVEAEKDVQSVCASLESLGEQWWEDAVRDAAGGDYVRMADNPPPGDGVWMDRGDFLVDAPDVLDTAPPGTPVPPDQNIYVNTVQAKCEMGEDRPNRRGGFIFFEAHDGSSTRSDGGKSVMCFEPDSLGADLVTPLTGQAPVPTKLVHASGCLTAASDDLARAFLDKGTEVYIGNRVVAWGSWNREMADALAAKIYGEGKTAEQAFNELKGEYVAKLRCAMWKKPPGGDVTYVDE